MPIRTSSGHHIAQPYNLDAGPIKLLGELQEGKQFSNTKDFPENTLYLKLALEYSFFRSNLLRFCIHLDKIKAFIRSSDTVYILCVVEENLLSLIYSSGILEICLPRFILREDLKIFNGSFYTCHENRLRVFQEDVSQLFKKLEIKASMLCFTIEEICTANQGALPQSSRLSELLKCNSKMQETGLQRQDFIITIEIKLTKIQITFLIGSKGTRIENLREESGATIKIVPISEKMTIHERNHPGTVHQTILISGDLYSVALATTSIESALNTLGL
ncbi:hypothetical protein SKDZ_14G1170 [Saccharomyces kudriavzevii ZP591]|nr:hypothetical protein SKDZ_14G1170 [Saccharomyces kudriavzevii ZP591]